MKQYLPFLFYLLNTYTGITQAQSNPYWYTSYDVKWYKIDIRANDTIAYVWGSTTILSEIKVSFADTFYFELANNVAIDSIKIFGLVHNYSRKGDEVNVPLSKHLSENYLLKVEIFHRGGNNGSDFFSSFSNKRDEEWNIPVTWTLSEPFGAKTWFPCKQSLIDKADSATVIITVPKHLKAGSNGKLNAVVAVDSFSNKFIWNTKYPVAYYLLSFTVADYKEYTFYAPTSVSDSVLVQNFYYNRPGFLEKNKKDMEATSQFISLFSNLFVEYPFKKEKYGHCLAPMGGGMEHQTMTTLSGFGNDLVSHELAHQWFGNLVTCANWQDIWINEGFASYAEYLAIEFLKSKDQSLKWLKHAFEYTYYYPQGSVLVPLEDTDNEKRIFNYCLTYKKGASIIHTLRNEIQNDTVFFSILKELLSVYAFKNASATDFIEKVNSKTGRNYNWFFDQWYYGKGFPEMELFWQQNNDSVKIMVTQKHSANGIKPFRIHYDIKLAHSGSDTLVRVLQDNWTQFYSIPTKNKLDIIEVNPEFETLMKIKGIYKVADFPTTDNAFSIFNANFSDALQIHFKTKTDKSSKIVITDIQGNPILDRKIKNIKTLMLDTKCFEPGYYLFYFITGKSKFIRIITKK